MKYKSLRKGVPILATLLLLLTPILTPIAIFSQSPNTCIDLTNGGILTMLKSMYPAQQIIKDGAATNITEPGSYQVLENIDGNILINASDVIINLNGFTVSGSTSSLIMVSEGQRNILIHNGSIVGDTTNDGVLVDKGTSGIFLQDLYLSNLQNSMNFAGEKGQEIKCSKVDNCFTTSCVKAYELTYVKRSVFKDCEVCFCQEAGFDLQYCMYNKFKHCIAVDVGSDDPTKMALGYVSESGVDNLFFECFAEHIYKGGYDSDWCTKAIGFLLTGTERESKIINCLVDSVSSTSWANAIGIKLDTRMLDSLSSVTTGLFDENIKDMDISPDCKHIAIACNDNSVRVLRFDGTSLSLVASDTLFDRPVNAVAWSPDAQYLAVGTDGEAVVLEGVTVNVGYRELEVDQVNSTHEINFLNDVKKELLVYKFDCGSLALVDDEYVGLNEIKRIYDGTTKTWSEGGGNIASGPYPSIMFPQGLPGPVRGMPDPNPFDLVWYGNWPFKIDNVKASDDVLRIVWSRDGRNIFVTTKGGKTTSVSGNTDWEDIIGYYINYAYLNFSFTEQAKIVSFSFDGSTIKAKKYKVLDSTNASKALAVSPDDKYISYGVSENANKLRIDEILADSFGTMVVDNASSNTLVDSVDWNPIACCDNYLLAVAGVLDGSNLEVFQYKGGTTVTSLVAQVFDSMLTSVKWAPSGKDLVVTGTGPTNEVGVFSFSVAGVTGTLESTFVYDTQIAGAKYIDWGECGKYIVIAGENTQDVLNVEVLEVGDSVKCCLVDSNKVANATGGLCSIGIMGASCCNCITRNVAYENCVNFTEGVYNVFYKGLAGKHSILGNWSIPPY
ncbi:WD40 repeat domain-containing protein [Candidatus Dependentiae bacterium]